jgi:hypothetical protein
MAMDFPSSPVDGQVYDNYIWSASSQAWKSKPSIPTLAVASVIAPNPASDGAIWLNSSDGTTYIYYNDGTSSQWIQAQSTQGEAGPAGTGNGPALPMISGKYYRTAFPMSNVPASTGTLMAVPIYVAKTTTIDRIGITTSTVTTAGTMRLGIYDDPENTGLPTRLVVDAGVVSFSANSTNYEITIATDLVPGWYWFANVQQSGASSFLGYTAYLSSGPTNQSLSAGSSSTVSNCYLGNSYSSGVLPATIIGAYYQGYSSPATYVRAL